MGYYINPPDRSKEDFLKEHGYPITGSGAVAAWSLPIIHLYLPVCLVDNGAFTAAAIGYDRAETERFYDTGPNDRRP